MATRRLPLSFAEFEPRGRQAILRTAEEVRAEDQLLDNQRAGSPESQNAGSPASQNARIPEPQSASLRETRKGGMPESQFAGNRALYSKATYRLSPEAIEAIEDAKSALRRQYGIKVSLEEIAEEAILAACRDLLESQHASCLVSRLAGKPESRRSRNAP